MKSAPTPPPAPDPTTVINASSAANDQAANLQSTLNNVNYQGPQGSTTYTQNPGTSQWTENVALNPTSQATYDTLNNTNYRAAKVADNQVLNVGNALQNSNLTAPSLQTGAATGNIQNGYNPGGPIQSQVAPTYSPFSSLGGQAQMGPPQGAQSMGGQPQPAQGQPSPSQSDPTYGGFLHHDDSSGWIPTVNDGTDPSGAHPGEMYDSSQGWVPATGAAVNPTQPQAAPTPSQSGAGMPQVGGQPAGATSPSSLQQMLSNPVLGTQAATYAQATQMLNPQWQQATEQQQAQLAAQGLNPNDAAYQNSMTLFGNQENNAYNSALYGAINAGDTEQNTLYGQNLGSAQYGLEAQGQQNSQNAAQAAFNNTAENQYYGQNLSNAQLANQAAESHFQNEAYAQQLPINDLTALMGDTQVGMPTSTPAQNTSVAAPDVTGAYGLNAQVNQANYAAKMQNYQSGLGGLFNLGSAAVMAMSDMRLKRDITKIGERPDGLGVYIFRYRAHQNWHIGCMAQEVQKIRPDAVFTQDGWLGVDYERLAA